MYRSLQLAVITSVHVDADGAFADVDILTDDGRFPCTARVTGAYAGPSYGFYCPVDVDDEVVIGVPDGDANHGYVILARCWSKSDPPPQEAKDHPQDVVLRVRKDKNLRMLTSGSGKTTVGVEQNGFLYLGKENATDFALLGTTYRNAEEACNTPVISAILTTLNAIPAAVDPASAALANGCKAALLALGNALQAFEAKKATFLSKNVKIGDGNS